VTIITKDNLGKMSKEIQDIVSDWAWGLLTTPEAREKLAVNGTKLFWDDISGKYCLE